MFCCRKIGYESRKQASLAAKSHRRTKGNKVCPYHCKHCGFWHLTSMSKKQFKALQHGKQQAEV